MIVDHRTDALQRHLGTLVGFCATEVGNVSEIVHIWAHEDLAESTGCRSAMTRLFAEAPRIYEVHQQQDIGAEIVFTHDVRE